MKHFVLPRMAYVCLYVFIVCSPAKKIMNESPTNKTGLCKLEMVITAKRKIKKMAADCGLVGQA